ncbi:MAG: helix-hairpin-helix domain-containing protein [Bacteroidota bacterium]
MSQSWKSILFFSKTERKGIVTLSVIILLIIWLPLLISQLLPEDDSTLDAFAKKTKLFLEEKSDPQKSSFSQNKISHDNPENDDVSAKEISIFDPNTIGLKQWLAMGFPQKLSERILKYRDKGGKFKTKEDLQKIFGMPEALYQKVNPYIVFASANEVKIPISPAITIEVIEINSADSAKLGTLPGINPYLVSRIIKYRNRLGGFVDKAQFAEIYGFGAKPQLSSLIRIDTSMIRKIDLNSCEFKELMKHPYGSYELAKSFCKFRDKYGKIKVLEEVRRAKVFPDSCFRKLYPYLKAG